MTDQPGDRQASRAPAASRETGHEGMAGGDDKTVALETPAPAVTAGPRPEAEGEGDATVATAVPQPVEPPPRQAPAALAPDEATRDDRTRTMKLASGSGPVDEPDETVIAAAPQGRPRLVLSTATGDEREFLLVRPEVSIGRDSSCDLVLSAPTVSRLHARIGQRGGEYILIPSGHHRNTYVNEEVVTQPRLLRDGDRIQLASERMAYRTSEGILETPQVRARLPLALGAAAVLIGLTVVAFYTLHRGAPPSQVAEQNRPSEARSEGNMGATGGPADAQALAAAAAAEQAKAEQERLAELTRQHEAELERQRAEEVSRQRDERIRKLLCEGDVASLEHRYTAPSEGSAVYAYRETLKIDPTNERALSQVAKIIDDYLTWAEQALAGGRRSQARLYAEKAAYVHGEVPGAGEVALIERRLGALRASLGSPK